MTTSQFKREYLRNEKRYGKRKKNLNYKGFLIFLQNLVKFGRQTAEITSLIFTHPLQFCMAHTAGVRSQRSRVALCLVIIIIITIIIIIMKYDRFVCV